MGDIYHKGDTYAGSVPIDDTQATATNTWSAQKINNEIDTKASKSIITSNDVFDPTKAYAAGDWLIHNNILYEVITACTGVTPPNATYYKVKNLHDLQSEINILEDITSHDATKFTQIASNTNLNSLTNPGLYLCPSGTVAGTLTNCPYTTGWFILEVYGTQYASQEIISTGTDQKFRRRSSNGTWSSWLSTGWTWMQLFTGDNTTGIIDISNVTRYSELNIIGYIGSNVGGSRFNVIVPTYGSWSLDYSIWLTGTTFGQFQIVNANQIRLSASNVHISKVYGK